MKLEIHRVGNTIMVGNVAKLRGGGFEGLKKFAAEVVPKISAAAPVLTGRLRESVQVERVDEKKGEVGIEMEFYGYFQDRGTVHHPGTGFVTKTMEREAKK